MIRSILNFLADGASYVFGKVVQIFTFLKDRFLDLNPFEKLIVINAGIAFFAIVRPVASYYIFETYYYINNKIAHQLIGIVIVMFITQKFYNKITFMIRELLCSLYLIQMIYLHAAGEISKAPYKLNFGYSLNIAVPIIFMAASYLSYRYYESP